jgi:hypothetical protein
MAATRRFLARRIPPLRPQPHGGAGLTAAMCCLLGAALGPWAATARAQDAPPAAPAFYTQGLSRVTDVQGDSFAFSRADGKTVRVRLFDADCRPFDESVRSQARAVAARLMEEEPVWVFPVGRTQGGTADEVWADVWTSKGWLSQVLLRTGYAQRRTGLEMSSLAPPDAAGTSNEGPAPAGAAFVAACKPVSGDIFEIDRGGRKASLRLFDATCETGASEATATATRLLGGPAWVFPCAPQPSEIKNPWLVRIWTAEGWLSDVLVKAGQAKRGEPAKDTAAATPAPTAKAAPTKRPPPVRPAPTTIEWKLIPATLAQSQRASGLSAQYARASIAAGGGYVDTGPVNGMETDVFPITSGAWRITWEATKGEKSNSPVTCLVYRCGVGQSESIAKVPSTQVGSFQITAGSQIFRTAPGRYWVKFLGSTTITLKVEEATLKAAETPAKATP